MKVSPLPRTPSPARTRPRPPAAADQFQPSEASTPWAKTVRGLTLLAATLACCSQDALSPTKPASAPQEFKLPGAGQWHPAVHENQRTFQIASQQEASVQRADPAFKNTLGDSYPVRIVRVSPTQVNFKIDHGQRIAVMFDPSFTPAQQTAATAHLIDLQTQAPPKSQGLVTHFEIRPAGSLGLVQAQTGGTLMRFIGAQNINAGVFFHEFGHFIGAQARLQAGPSHTAPLANKAPDSWVQAIHDDHGKIVSDYARHTVKAESPAQGFGEDFAEFFSSYCEARSQGTSALRQLEQKFPARTRLMTRVWKQFSTP